MPVEPAAERRPAAALVAPEADDADVEPGDGEEAADQRGPDHHVAPQRRVLAKHERIDPVGDGPEPAPDPLGAGGVLDHLAGPGRDIDLRSRRVVESQAIDGTSAAGPLHRPLVLGDQAQQPRTSGDPVSRAIGPGDRQGVGRLDPGDGPAAGQVEHLRLADLRLQAQHRPPGQHLDPEVRNPIGCAQAQTLSVTAALQLQRFKPGLALCGGQPRIALVHHHEARQAPQGHHQAHGDAEVPMDHQDHAHSGPRSRGAGLRSCSCSWP